MRTPLCSFKFRCPNVTNSSIGLADGLSNRFDGAFILISFFEGASVQLREIAIVCPPLLWLRGGRAKVRHPPFEVEYLGGRKCILGISDGG